MDILEKAQELERQGRHIIHLEIGEPDFPTPGPVCEAAEEAIRAQKTHYTHSLGIRELREAISAHYHEEYNVSVDPDCILVTSGTSPALFMIFSALLEKGDEIILSDPHYPCYPNFARFLEACPVFVRTEESEGFQLDPSRSRVILVPRPRQCSSTLLRTPPGTLLSKDRMERIADMGLPVISDEIYHGLVYGEKEHSILEFTESAFVLNGFSKLYAMTGWRLGYIIAPKDFIRPLQKIQQNFLISAGSISQWAGIAALTKADDEVQAMKAVYDERRRLHDPEGPGIGIWAPCRATRRLLYARQCPTHFLRLLCSCLYPPGKGRSGC